MAPVGGVATTQDRYAANNTDRTAHDATIWPHFETQMPSCDTKAMTSKLKRAARNDIPPRLRQKSQSTARRVWIASPPQPQPTPLPQLRCSSWNLLKRFTSLGQLGEARYALDITRPCCGRSCEWMNRRRRWPIGILWLSLLESRHELTLLEVMLRIPKLYGWEVESSCWCAWKILELWICIVCQRCFPPSLWRWGWRRCCLHQAWCGLRCVGLV